MPEINAAVTEIGDQMAVSLKSNPTVGDKVFYIYAYNGWGTTYLTPKQVTMKVICDTTSTSIDFGAFPGSFGATQILPIASKFTLPVLTSSNS